jgi:hypothetical protein
LVDLIVEPVRDQDPLKPGGEKEGDRRLDGPVDGLPGNDRVGEGAQIGVDHMQRKLELLGDPADPPLHLPDQGRLMRHVEEQIESADEDQIGDLRMV